MMWRFNVFPLLYTKAIIRPRPVEVSTTIKAVVKRKHPRIPAFNYSSNRFHIFYKSSSMRYNVCTNWEPPYAHKHPCSRRALTKLERVIAQTDRAVPLKLRACEVQQRALRLKCLCLDMPCRSNSSSEKSALAATPQIGGNPALGL